MKHVTVFHFRLIYLTHLGIIHKWLGLLYYYDLRFDAFARDANPPKFSEFKSARDAFGGSVPPHVSLPKHGIGSSCGGIAG